MLNAQARRGSPSFSTANGARAAKELLDRDSGFQVLEIVGGAAQRARDHDLGLDAAKRRDVISLLWIIRLAVSIR